MITSWKLCAAHCAEGGGSSKEPLLAALHCAARVSPVAARQAHAFRMGRLGAQRTTAGKLPGEAAKQDPQMLAALVPLLLRGVSPDSLPSLKTPQRAMVRVVKNCVTIKQGDRSLLPSHLLAYFKRNPIKCRRQSDCCHRGFRMCSCDLDYSACRSLCDMQRTTHAYPRPALVVAAGQR
jgi:hypothetical protein